MAGQNGSEATKRMLTAALKRLMAQKPLGKISIREITESCGMNRQTFYYHFEDIYDQVRWMYQQDALALLEEQEGVLVWQDSLLRLFHYLEENRAVCLCTLDSISHEQLRRFCYADIYDFFHHIIDALEKDIGSDEKYKNFLTHFYVTALAGIVEGWLRGRLTESPEELVKLAEVVVRDQYAGARLRLEKEKG